jgi:hypothetical protein
MNRVATQEPVKIPVYYHTNQEKIFFGSTAKKKVIAKGRRFGLTKGYANRAVEYLCDGIGPGLWVDTVNSNIDRYVERYFYPVLRSVPQRYWKWRQQRKELELFGQKLDMRSADRPELIEGFGYKFILLNEAGIILRREYLYHNTILPMTLDFNPDFYVGGTPKGKGLFHQLATRAQDSGNGDWQFFHFTSFDNPYLTKKELAGLVEEIPKSVQEQEVYAKFLEDSSTVFRNIKACTTAAPQAPKKGHPYYAGLDLARVQDYTVLVILDRHGKMVFMDRFNQLDWEFQKQRVAGHIKKYNNAQLLVDSTGVGDPIYEDLKRMGLSVDGYKLTNESKKQLIQALMIAFEMVNIGIIDDPVLINELLIYEYEMTASGSIRYNAPEGYHDDTVIALALANWALKNTVVPNIRIVG